MSRKFLVSIDLNKNELQNAAIQNLATAPSSPVAGQIYYNTTDNAIFFWNGSAWVTPSAAQITSGLLASRPTAATAGSNKFYYATDNYLLYYSDGSTWQQTNNFGTVTAQTSYGLTSGNGSATTYARADHTHGTPALGTATPTAITGTASAGSATAPSKEDHTHAFTPTQNLSMATYKLTNLGTPTTSTDAATKAYADTMLPLAGGTMSGAIAMGTSKITGLGDPSAAQDAATKAYVDSVAQGLDVKASVRAATTTAGTLATSFANGQVIDGVTLATGNRILIKNQATGSENGIYTVNASGAPTRALDMDAAAEFPSAFTFVEEGTTLADTGWVCTNNAPVTVGTTPIVFAQFSGAGQYVAGDGLTLTGNIFAVGAGTGITVAADTVSLTNTSLTVNGTAISLGGSGTVTANTTNALTLGTGLTGTSFNGSAAVTAAIDTTVVVRKYATNVGDGTAVAYTITHNLNTRDVLVTLYDNSSPYAELICDVEHTTVNTVTLRFSVAPTSNQYRVAVQG